MDHNVAKLQLSVEQLRPLYHEAKLALGIVQQLRPLYHEAKLALDIVQQLRPLYHVPN